MDLKDYLISFGVDINETELASLMKSMEKIKKITTSFKLPFITINSLIATGFIATVIATGKLIKDTADASMQYKKFALDTWMDNQSAKRLQTVTKAMGESVEDIAWIPELRQQYFELLNLGNTMQTPGDAESQLKYIRSIELEFKKLRVEISYAAEWISYYLIKYLSEPIGKAKQELKDYNDKLMQTMPEWTNTIANILSTIIIVGTNLSRFVMALGRGMETFFNIFPKSMRILGILITGIGLAFKFNPIFATITSLVLLIDDFYDHVDGRKSLSTLTIVWGSLLEKLSQFNSYSDKERNVFEIFWRNIVNYWNDLKNKINECTEYTKKMWKTFEQSQTYENLGNALINDSKALKEEIKAFKNILSTLIMEMLISLTKYGVFEQFKKTMEAASFSLNKISANVKNIIIKMRKAIETNFFKLFLSFFADNLAAIIKNALVLTEAGAHIISSLLLFATGDVAGGSREAILAGMAITKYIAGINGRTYSTNTGSNGKSGLEIEGGVEDYDLSHTQQYIVDKVKELNDFSVSNFGKELIVTGGWRSTENNSSVNGAEGSYHLTGEAVDIDVSNFSDDERKAIFDKAGELGFNTESDIIYHDMGTGYHMHLQPSAGHAIVPDIGSNYTAQPTQSASQTTRNLGSYDFSFTGNNVTADQIKNAVATSLGGVL